jgi:hypothetical protein
MYQPAVYTFKALAVLVYAVVSFFSYWAMLRMSADPLLVLNVLAQLALIIMGVLLSLRDAWPKRHPWIVVAAFALAGGVALFATYRQSQLSGRETAEAQRQVAEAQRQTAIATTQLSDSMNRLGTQTGEISRVQGLNTQLQNKLVNQSGQLIDSNKQISGLSKQAIETTKQAIETTTGGDSFCHVWVTDALIPFFYQVGRQPLYDVRARITFLNYGAPPQLRSPGIVITVGTMAMNSIYPSDQKLPINESSNWEILRIVFDARNGRWVQDILMRKVSVSYGGQSTKTWAQATRVARITISDEGARYAVIYESVPKGFYLGDPPEWPNYPVGLWP